MLTLRDYQTEAIAEVRTAWAGGVRRPAIILPTGAGKTVVFVAVAADMAAFGVRSLILAHRDELIEQAVAKVRRDAAGLRVGIVKGPKVEIRGRDIVVASVQTLGRKTGRAERLRDELRRTGVRLVIVDECHHAVADSYMLILRELGCFDDVPADGALTGAYTLGVTATMSRTDKLALGQVWQKIVYRREIVRMIRDGHLVNAKGVRIKVAGLDLSRVKKTGGDFQAGALGEAMHDALAPAAIARAYVEHARNRRSVLFAPNVALGYEIADALRQAGVRAIAFDGTTPLLERRRILKGFEAGEYDAVCNCGVLTEGFDAPWCDCVVIARPTSSAGLYVQMAGRGLRPSPQTGKRDCLIMDVVGVTGRMRLASIVDLGGAERVEELDEDLAQYEPDDEVDLLDLLDPASPRARPGPDRVDGPTVSEIVDLFGQSRRAWLRTRQGVWFLDAPNDRIVFLAPHQARDRYMVCRVGLRIEGGEYLRRDLDFDSAMSWGEHYAADGVGSVLSQRGAAWRRAAPTTQQLARAARLDITSEGLTRGQLAEALSVIAASARVDGTAVVRGVTQGGYW